MDFVVKNMEALSIKDEVSKLRPGEHINLPSHTPYPGGAADRSAHSARPCW